MTESTDNRAILVSRMLKAPVEQIWQVWTTPDHIAKWWGPKGFTNTIHQMDLKEDGEWKLTMHGPDGKTYPNRSAFKEIIPLKKIVFEHFNPHFITTVLFEAENTNTKIEWTMLFDTAEMRDIVVKAHNAEEGQKENLDKLENYLSKL